MDYRPIAVAFASCVLAGCATLDTSGRASADDPFEPVNRVVFDFNTALDRHVIEPVARTYRDVVPAIVRDRVRFVLDNLAEPRIFLNDMLQGRGDAAGTTFARFFINTTVGFFGFFDQASESGYEKQTGDFGQTLYAWGVDDGPYLVLLFFGPSNVRDAIGLGVDFYTTFPSHLIGGHDAWKISLGIGALDGLDLRARNLDVIDELRRSSLDPYTHFKSVTRQYRHAQLRPARGETQEPPELEDPGATPR
jgi:phospholipid-binding lipoprotein MlaA